MTHKLWGGRFEGEPSQLLRRFNDSFAFDCELFAEDVEGSIAWAHALARAGVLTQNEASTIVTGLERVPAPDAARESQTDESYEDIHSYVESKLYDDIGDLAGKLHTGRSRNDQVATDLRLWLKRAAIELEQNVIAFMHTLASIAGEEAATPMPGYTHLKQAEPITFGH